MDMRETRQLSGSYRLLAATLPANSLYQRARDEGATKIEAIILPRDLYGLSLPEC
jgi:hypothetical protein